MRRLIALALLLAPSPAWAAFANVGTFLVGNNGSAATTYAPTTSAALEAGNLGVCVIAKDETGSGTTDDDNDQVISVTDAAGNLWVQAVSYANMQSSTAANGALVSIWYTVATTQLNSAAAITFTFSASTTRKAVTCEEFTKGGSTVVALTAGTSTLSNDAADPGSMTVATGESVEHLFIRTSSCESNVTSYTADTDYTGFAGSTTTSTSNSGTAATSIGARGEWRIATESTSAASNPTHATADCASAMIGLDEITLASTNFTYIAQCSGVGPTGPATTEDCDTTLNVAAGDLLIAIGAWNTTTFVGTLPSVAVASVSGSPPNDFTFDSADKCNGNGSADIHSAVGYVLSAAADSSATFRLTIGTAYRWPEIRVLQFRPTSGATVTKDASTYFGDVPWGVMGSGDITTSAGGGVVVGLIGTDTDLELDQISGASLRGAYAEVNSNASEVGATAFWYRTDLPAFTTRGSIATMVLNGLGGGNNGNMHIAAFKATLSATCTTRMALMGVGCK